MTRLNRITLLLLLPFAFALSACDRSPIDEEHDELTRAVIEIRATGEVVAEWTVQNGWNVDELRPLPGESTGGERLFADGPRASLTIRLFDEDGDEFDIRTVSNVGGVRTCSEYSVRYRVSGGNTGVIAWPPVVEGGVVTKDVLRTDGERVAIFHCDHIHIYPEAAGETQFQLQLWHLDHDDAATDPLRLVVD